MRNLFGIFAAISLAAAIALGVMWVVSYSATDLWGARRETIYSGRLHVCVMAVLSNKGELGITIENVMPLNNMPAGNSWGHSRFRPPWKWAADSAFDFYTSNQMLTPGRSNMNYLGFPYWSAVVFFSLPAALYLLIWRRKKIPGTCPTCGYDLRATPNQCPECGKLINLPASN